MFKWFKRNKDPNYFETTSNINPIGVARVNDIKKLIRQIEQRATKEYVDQNDTKTLNDSKVYTDQQIANIPSVDLTNYALKNANNNFVTQNIKDNAAFLGFVRLANNQRVGYVGKSSSTTNDIELRAETNSLNIVAKHNINLRPGENYNVISEKIPTANNHVTNKAYVDNAIANITPPSVDLTDVVKTNESANLMGDLYFFGNENGYVGYAGRAQYSNASYEPSDDNEFAPKGYVDKKLNGLIRTGALRKGVYLDWVKSDIVSKLYNYKLVEDQKVEIIIPNNLVGRNVAIYLFVSSVEGSGVQRTLFEGTLAAYAYISNVNATYDLPLENINLITTIDLKPGASGQFNTMTRFEGIIVEN